MNFFVFVIFFFLPPLSLSLSFSPVSPSLSPLYLTLFFPCISLSHHVSLPIFLSLFLLPRLSTYLSLSLSLLSLFLSFSPIPVSLSLFLFLLYPSLSSPSPSPTHVFLLFFSHPCLSLSLSILSFSLPPCLSFSVALSLSLSLSLSFSLSLSHLPLYLFFLSFSLQFLSLSLYHTYLSFSPIPVSLFLPPLSFFLSLSNPGFSPFLPLMVSSYLSLSHPAFLSIFFSRCLSPTIVSFSSFSLPLYLWFTLCGFLFLFLFLSRSCLSFYLFSLSL